MAPLSSFTVQTTTHDDIGASIFRPTNPAPKPIATGASGEITIVYSVSPTTPRDREGRLSLADEADIVAHEQAPAKSPQPGGCAVATIVTPPRYDGGPPEMHRTRTVDVGVCVAGEGRLRLS